MKKEHVTIHISELKYHPKNPKGHNDRLIKQSISEFGFVDDIVIDEDNMILAGHGRVKAMQSLDKEKIDCIRITGWTEEQKDKFLILSNKSVETGGWNDEMLKEFDKEFLRDTGFNTQELDRLFSDYKKEDDEVPDEPEEPISEIGQFYKLGNHFLFCGDATKQEHVEALMQGIKADMVFTDPPYKENFYKFLIATFKNYRKFSKVSAGFYICHSSSSQIQFEEAMAIAEIFVKNQIIWNKLVASMGWGNYRWKHEPIFYATIKKSNVEFYGDRSQYTVWDEKWDYDKAKAMIEKIATRQENGQSSVWKMGRDVNYKHPTQKPVELICMALKNSSKEEDVVLDLFGGSGSTLVACEKMNRSCFMMELDPKYIDVIIERWEDYTGEKAILLDPAEPASA